MPHSLSPFPSGNPFPGRYDLTGILLAGGKSSRMGTEKGLVEFKGKPLIRIGIELLSHFTNQILISTGNEDYTQFGLQLVPDEVGNQGPAAGIASSLKFSSTPWNIVIACDLPFLTPLLISLLLDNKTNNQAVVPLHDNHIEPLAALYHKDMAELIALEVLSGNLAMHRILHNFKVNYLETDYLVAKNPLLFENINTQLALDRFK